MLGKTVLSNHLQPGGVHCIPQKHWKTPGKPTMQQVSILIFIHHLNSSPSVLIPLPPDIPSIWQKVDNLLKPTYRVLSIFQESISSGDQTEFAMRVWEKAQSEEPFVLAQRTLSNAYEQWKKRDEPGEDEERKGST